MRITVSVRCRSACVVLVASLLGLAGVSSIARAGPGGESQPGSGVVRVRRGGSGDGGGTSTVVVTRGAREGDHASGASGDEEAAGASGKSAGDGGPGAAAGLEGGESDRPSGLGGETPFEIIEFPEIGVVGARKGRTVRLVGAEVVFADGEVRVRRGVPLGFAGVMGEPRPMSAAAPVVEFELLSGGPVTLSIQPVAANPATPSRPIRTITMAVP